MLLFKNKDTRHYENLVHKPLSEFTAKNTLYAIRKKNDFSYWYFCRFIKFEKGIIHVKIIEKQNKWVGDEVGDILTVRPTSCCLWGKEFKENRYSFYWFNLDGTIRR